MDSIARGTVGKDFRDVAEQKSKDIFNAAQAADLRNKEAAGKGFELNLTWRDIIEVSTPGVVNATPGESETDMDDEESEEINGNGNRLAEITEE